jgi:hypothetical protein
MQPSELHQLFRAFFLSSIYAGAPVLSVSPGDVKYLWLHGRRCQMLFPEEPKPRPDVGTGLGDTFRRYYYCNRNLRVLNTDTLRILGDKAPAAAFRCWMLSLIGDADLFPWLYSYDELDDAVFRVAATCPIGATFRPGIFSGAGSPGEQRRSENSPHDPSTSW